MITEIWITTELPHAYSVPNFRQDQSFRDQVGLDDRIAGFVRPARPVAAGGYLRAGPESAPEACFRTVRVIGAEGVSRIRSG
jgi:hypothetical protein